MHEARTPADDEARLRCCGGRSSTAAGLNRELRIRQLHPSRCRSRRLHSLQTRRHGYHQDRSLLLLTTSYQTIPQTNHPQAALEARGSNIRVNAVSPGFLLTDLLAGPMNDGVLTPEVWKVYEDRQGRKATFNEIGDVVVLLSTPRMSLVNGHNLVIDGGFTINENTV